MKLPPRLVPTVALEQLEQGFPRLWVVIFAEFCEVLKKLYAAPVGFFQASKTAIKRWNDFRGQSSRSEFWWFQLLLGLTFFVFMFGIFLIFGLWDAEPTDEQANLFAGLWATTVLVPALSVQIRRLRDAGFHWGFVALPMVPFLGSLALFVMFLFPSKGFSQGANSSLAPEKGDSKLTAGGNLESGSGPGVSKIDRLTNLHQEGRISEEQFKAAKRRLLGE